MMTKRNKTNNTETTLTDTNQPTLLSIPEEVWKMILTHLFPSDVKSLRLTCRRLRQMTFNFMVSLTAHHFEPLPVFNIKLNLLMTSDFYYPANRSRIQRSGSTALIHTIVPLFLKGFFVLEDKTLKKFPHLSGKAPSFFSEKTILQDVDDLVSFFSPKSHPACLMRLEKDIYLFKTTILLVKILDEETITLPKPLTLPSDVKSTHKILITNQPAFYSAIAFLLQDGQLVFAKDHDLSQFHPPTHPYLTKKKFKRAWSDNTSTQLALLDQDGYLYLWKTQDKTSPIKRTKERFNDLIQVILFKNALLISQNNKPHRLFVATPEDEFLAEQDSFFEGKTDFHHSNLYLLKNNAGVNVQGEPSTSALQNLNKFIEVLAVSREDLNKKTMLFFDYFPKHHDPSGYSLLLAREHSKMLAANEVSLLTNKYEELEKRNTPFFEALKKKLPKNPSQVAKSDALKAS